MTTFDETEKGTLAGSCPVRNLDYQAERPVGDWFATHDQFRAEGPLYRNELGPGFWTIVNYDGILEVMQDADTFSNSVVTPLDPNPQYKWIPEMLDGDEHRQWRKLLGPIFAPKAMAAMEEPVRERAAELIDEILSEGNGSTDFQTSFAQRYPTSIFLELLGLPVEELPQFMEWEMAILHSDEEDLEARKAKRMAAMMAVMGRFGEVIADKRANPSDDIISKALQFEIDGEPVSDNDLLSFCLLMFMAGLDTVTATLGYIFHHLATHPEDRERLVEDPSLIPGAVEEFLRVFAIVSPARKVMKDTEIQGCPMKAGDMVAFPLSAATRDEKAFSDPQRVDITRSPNNHIGFGAGPHRCLGSHLARRELTVAIEEWHKRIPSYRVAPGAEITETGGMHGLTSLPIEWDATDG